mmetsp:Transcript_25991/g.77423  ORF Transcript_25991/g.77423 Transcript_25991/m.77423 type:complete len:208 (+) Transcript_25991:2278-2901(+)
MCSMILCSPSPGTAAPEKTTRGPSRQAGSVVILCAIHSSYLPPRRCRKSVPGVMQFESNGGGGGGPPKVSTSGGGGGRCEPRGWPVVGASPAWRKRALAFALSRSACCASSLGTRYRRERCWFIFARGATPSMATYSSRCGRTSWTSVSRYEQMASIMSASVGAAAPLRAGGSLAPWVALWRMPFASMYRLSTSAKGGDEAGRLMSG